MLRQLALRLLVAVCALIEWLGARMNKRKIFIAIGLACILIVFLFAVYMSGGGVRTLLSRAVVYYVSLTGSDANPGTQASPWRTIQKCAYVAPPDSTCIILAGTYAERVSVERDGITFQAQGAIAKGFVIRADYTTIRDFEIANTDRQNAGIYVKGAYNVIEDNYVHHAATRAIEFGGYKADNTILLVHDNIVRNNRLYYNGNSGIFVNGRDNLIENNEIWETQQCLPVSGTCKDADGILFFGQGHIIRNNYIHDISYGPPGINPEIGDYNDDPHIDCFQTYDNSDYTEQASDILFEGNICDNLQYQNDYEKGQGWMMEGGAHDITIINNVVRTYRGLNTRGGTGTQADHLYIYNNTFVNNLAFPAQPNVAELYNATYSIIKNNIFYDQKNGTLDLAGDTTGIVVDYNLVYNTDGSLPIYMPYPVLHELRRVDPQFINPGAKDYHLQSTSPACDGGEDGTYIGALPCDVSTQTPTFTPLPPTVTKTSTPVPPTVTRIVPPTHTMTATLEPTSTATITPTLTLTPTLVPTYTPKPDLCVRVVWDKGIATQGLNMRNGPSMGDNADGRSYLGPGFEFTPLATVNVPSIGTAYKVAEPNWFIFGNLVYRPDDIYTVECE